MKNLEVKDLKKILKKKRKIEFTRPWSFRLKRLKDSWRKPKGLDDKHRLQVSGYKPIVKIGYRNPKVIRGLHPSGYIEKIVHNPEDLEGLDPKKVAIRISHTVSRKKRIEIVKKAMEMGIKILNPTKIEIGE